MSQDKESCVKVTTDSLRELKEEISTTALDLNTQKEKNSKDEKEIRELRELLNSLNKHIEFADTEFTTNWLDEFDKLYESQYKATKFPDKMNTLTYNMNSNEIYKSMNVLLKKMEKEYNFNAIDPIDEARDLEELKKRFKENELHN